MPTRLIVAASVVEALTGTVLAAVFFVAGPWSAFVFGIVMVAQGGYTALVLLRRIEAKILFLIGEGVAFSVFGAAAVYGLVRNLDPANVDPEYAPMTLAVGIACQAVLASWALLRTTPRRPSPHPG
jgi:hypothetical protein